MLQNRLCQSAAIALLFAAPLLAQSGAVPNAVTITGRGPETYVLLSGLVGGVAGFRRLQAVLLADGNRVVVIDPYNLSVDSTDVTFAALARRVDALLASHAMTSVRVIGHAHGGGVALRLAANYPNRVSSLCLLDVGALPGNRTSVFGASLRWLPMISRLPGGREFLRGRIIHGLEKNSGHTAWLDSASRRDYTEPLLTNLDRLVSLARRLGAAREPDSLPTLVSRIRVPVLVIIGDVPHASGLNPGELDALHPLGALLHIEHVSAAGHFVHEEAPAEVARYLVRAKARSPIY